MPIHKKGWVATKIKATNPRTPQKGGLDPTGKLRKPTGLIFVGKMKLYFLSINSKLSRINSKPLRINANLSRNDAFLLRINAKG